ncbi:restriction endonuclease subunit S [Pseudomonas sp. zjy_11]|uniref:restriction endonuclease subunit S n=1 Tax=unclassified Pseudomonas TaxID=196821 RepID=UPI00370B40DB
MVEIPLIFSEYHSVGPTEVNYLPSLPTHWNVEKGKWLFKKENRPVQQKDEVVTCFRDGEVTLRRNRRTEGFTNALLEHGYQGIRKNDLVIHAMDAFAGAIGVSDSDGKSSPVYAACTPINPKLVNPYFYAYFMRDLALSGYLTSLAKGIRERSTDFRFKDFSELLLPVPPFEEQFLIASFLDKKLTQIDRAIRVKERQIDRLKERKQILIQQVVTRGLDSHAPMQDSGLEWIGEIPAHWSMMANRALFRERVEPGREDLPLLSVSIHSGVSEEEISEEENIRGRVKIEDKSKYICVRPGDIAFNMMRAWQGAIGAVRVEGMVSPAYTIAIPRPSLDARYFEYQYRTPGFIQQMDRYSKGITDFRKRLYWDGFKQLITLVPPIDEQQSIIEYIEQAMQKQNAAVALLEQQISKLKDYKAILINTAITGKIKVPGVVEPVIPDIEVA